MKKQLFLAAFLIIGLNQLSAQEKTKASLDNYASNSAPTQFWDKTSLEVSYGFAMPFSPADGLEVADYNSFVNFQLGANYQFNNFWGARLTYAYQNFENKNNSNYGVDYNKFMAEATFNIISAVNPSAIYTQEKKFEVIAHAGIGGTFAKSKSTKVKEEIYNAQIGLKPTYEISRKVNIFADVTYVFNLHQDLAYSGASAKIDGGNVSGSYLNTMIGLQVKLGR